jgi:hypothetical protein
METLILRDALPLSPAHGAALDELPQSACMSVARRSQ